MSCTKPGKVSSIEREPPPMVSFASNTITDRPVRAIVMAAARPFGPPPTTTASYVDALTIFVILCFLCFLTLAAPYPAKRRRHSVHGRAHRGIIPDVFCLRPLQARVYTDQLFLHNYLCLPLNMRRQRF